MNIADLASRTCDAFAAHLWSGSSEPYRIDKWVSHEEPTVKVAV